ncbi:MAG: SDR family NAD(P)-dependent oxidoreductase [Cryomorphaceae bacterium]|nr:SDR family NAD(P)-dependent oxidoreductase [Cryomorphaceae bacterium]
MYIIITGSSSGLGKALAEAFLQNDINHHVLGISRSKTINHPRYKHMHADLSNLVDIESLHLNIPKNKDNCLLINNAGQIEPIGFTHRLDASSLAKHYQLNVLAVHAICAKFLDATENKPQRHIINISSGAGKYPVKGWSAYCAGKAAVDALSKVIAEEYSDVDIWSLAPGIVDTPMQKTIRNTPKESFPDQPRFEGYHKNNELTNANQTAANIIQLINRKEKIDDVVISLRDFA